MTAARDEFTELRSALMRRIDDKLAEARRRGLHAADLGHDQTLADRVAAAIPTGHPVADTVGPCYDTPGLTRWLGISKQALAKRVANKTVLGCRSSDGHWLYPAWQFDEHGNASRDLPELITILAGPDDDRWRAAVWLSAPSPDLPDAEPAGAWLARGGAADIVLRAARADAARWAA